MRLPGGDIGLIVLDDSLQLVQGLIEPRLPGLQGVHLGIQRRKLAAIRLRQRRDPVGQHPVFLLLVFRRLQKRRDITGEALAKIVDQAHPDDLVDIQLRELILHEKRHQRDAPAVLGDAFATALRRVAVAQLVLEPLGDM